MESQLKTASAARRPLMLIHRPHWKLVNSVPNPQPTDSGVAYTLRPVTLCQMNSLGPPFCEATTGLPAAQLSIFNSDKINLTAKDYAAAGNQARDASFKLWRVADAELDILLQKRIEYYKHTGPAV